jgi:hypothetical protein
LRQHSFRSTLYTHLKTSKSSDWPPTRCFAPSAFQLLQLSCSRLLLQSPHNCHDPEAPRPLRRRHPGIGSTPLAAAPSALSRFPRQPHSLTPASTGPGHRPHQRPRRNPQLWQQPGEVRHPAPSGPAGRRLSGMRGHDWLRALRPVRQAGPRQPRHRARQGKAGARAAPRHSESARAPHAARLQQRLCHTAVPAALSVSNWDFVSPVCRSRMRSGPT